MGTHQFEIVTDSPGVHARGSDMDIDQVRWSIAAAVSSTKWTLDCNREQSK